MEESRGVRSKTLRAPVATVLGLVLWLALAWIVWMRQHGEGKPG